MECWDKVIIIIIIIININNIIIIIIAFIIIIIINIIIILSLLLSVHIESQLTSCILKRHFQTKFFHVRIIEYFVQHINNSFLLGSDQNRKLYISRAVIGNNINFLTVFIL